MDPVRLLVVADDPLSRAGLAALLSGRADVAVAGEVRADEAARAAAELRAGAAVWDLGPPGAAPPALAAAAVAAAHGLATLDAALAEDWLRPPEAAGGAEGLTAREREVLGLLAEGLGNRAIAVRLGISEHTAKFHVNAILAKLGAESRSAAIVKAARLGLVAL